MRKAQSSFRLRSVTKYFTLEQKEYKLLSTKTYTKLAFCNYQTECRPSTEKDLPSRVSSPNSFGKQRRLQKESNGVYTVKLTRAKLPANAGKFTSGLHIKGPDTQFTRVSCSLPVKTGKFIRVYAASTSRRIHANCLQPHVNLPE